MLKLFVEYTNSLVGNVQIIVIDHADYDDNWFKDSVVHNGRNGKKVMPSD